MDRGFQFLHPRNADGAVICVVGLRAHHDVVDLVQLYGEQDAQAARVPADEQDVFAPNVVLWRQTGSTCEVIDAMLALPDPRPEEQADCQKGCWVPVSPGQSKWLSMPA